MPNRDRRHRLAEEAVRALAGAVEPRFKFYDRPQPEYGIDGDLEEFDDDRRTGLHCFVQVKGTDEEDLGPGLAEDISLDTANYYRAASMPVLMVRYHAPTGDLYVRWFHQYDPYEGRGGKKTLTFRWLPEDRFDEHTTERIAAETRAYEALQKAGLRTPVPIYLATDGAFGLEGAQISIALRAGAARRSDVVRFESGSPPDGAVVIHINDEELRVDLGKVTSATLHFPADDQVHDVPADQLATEALMLVALAFERVGQDGLVTRLASTYLQDSFLVTQLDALFALAWSYARAHRIREALELSGALDDPEDSERAEAALVLGLPALYWGASLTDGEAKKHREVLKARAKRRRKSDPQGAGRSYMNLATFHRARGEWDAAANYYAEALTLDPQYEQRAHFWYERGGALWGTHQFEKAAEAYSRAIDLGSDAPLVQALQADSLMFAGHYGQALELFERYNDAHPEDDGEYRLKAYALRMLIERLGISQQDRDMHGALEAASGPEPVTPQQWASMSERQLAKDALWGSAWLNLGLADQDRNRLAAAFKCFVAATILIPDDYEPWHNAIILALAVGDEDALTDLLVSGRRMGGDELISSLLEVAGRDDNPVPLDQVAATVERILTAHPQHQQPGYTVRILGEDGRVEEIDASEETERQQPGD